MHLGSTFIEIKLHYKCKYSVINKYKAKSHSVRKGETVHITYMTV